MMKNIKLEHQESECIPVWVQTVQTVLIRALIVPFVCLVAER